MRIKKIELIVRHNGFFYYNGKKIPAIKHGNGVGVALILEKSPVDEDFGDNILFLSEDQRQEILDKFNQSDDLTVALVGHDWNYGVRPHKRKFTQQELNDLFNEIEALTEDEGEIND